MKWYKDGLWGLKIEFADEVGLANPIVVVGSLTTPL